MTGALPNVMVIGAMKCGTSAVHAYLDAHPQVQMSRPKELNFFNGPERAPHDDPGLWWKDGQWHRGLDWYRAQFDPHVPARGESSPAYTSPTSPRAPARMAATIPDARLVYLVRDPVERAASQYAHHRREGDENRSIDAALLDPDSHYIARSRYAERLAPYTGLFDRGQIRVVVQERLLHRREEEIAALYDHVGVDPGWRHPVHDERHHVGDAPAVPGPLREAVLEHVADDLADLRELLDDELAEWDR